MSVLALAAAAALYSCGSSNSEGEDNPPFLPSGGGASAENFPGNYIAISTTAGYELYARFAPDGSGLFTLKSNYGPMTYSFSYVMAGSSGYLILEEPENSYNNTFSTKASGSDAYTIQIEEGFILIKDMEGNMYAILCKDGQDLGKPDNSRFVGTWGDYYGDSIVVKSDGTGFLSIVGEKDYIPFTYSTKNPYVASVIFSAGGYSGSTPVICSAIVVGGKLYPCTEFGDVDAGMIFAKR